MSTTIDISSLYRIAQDNQIKIINHHFSETKKAACMYEENNYKTIILDKRKIKSVSEENVILFEELSHYESGIMPSKSTPLLQTFKGH